MAGTEVDYNAFSTFVTATQEAMMADGTASAGPLADIAMPGSITGSMGTDAAMFFGAMNRQAIKSIQAYMSDQMIGRMALSNAAANVALAYHDGDLGQKGQVSDVMDGILSPKGKDGTVRGQMEAAAGEGEGTGSSDTGSGYELPEVTTNEDGEILDAQGRVLFKADGTPGNPQALEDAGIDPNEEGGDGSGTSSYYQYITRVNNAQTAYYANWTGTKKEDLGENPQDLLAKNQDKDASPDQEALGEARNDLVNPTPEAEYDGEGYGDENASPAPVEDPEPEDQPDITVYQEPTPG